MVDPSRRYPDSNNFSFSSKCKTKGLASNTAIFCPQLKNWDCICLVCYNCEFGFNGTCPTFMEKVKAKPLIIKELYLPVSELIKKEFDSTLIGCSGKLLSIGAKRDKRKKLYVLKKKLVLRIRFIPKFEEVNLPYEDELFFKEGETRPLTYSEIPSRCCSGDILYSINQNKKHISAIKLMEKLNVKKDV